MTAQPDGGRAQAGDDTPREDAPNVAALLELDDAERGRIAFGEPDEDSPESRSEDDDLDDDDPDSEDDEADLEDEDAADDDEDDDDEEDAEDEEEDEPEATFDPKTATPADWYFELLAKPQRYSEVPRKMRTQVDRFIQTAQQIAYNAAQVAARNAQTAEERTTALRELWEAGDLEAFAAEEARDPDAAELFAQQRMAAARSAKAKQEYDPSVEAQILTDAQRQLARLNDHPEAKARVDEVIVKRGWNREGSATRDTLAELTAVIDQEIGRASRPSKSAERATRTRTAAQRRRNLPKPDVSRGAHSTGKINPDEFLAKDEAERGRIAFGGG